MHFQRLFWFSNDFVFWQMQGIDVKSASYLWLHKSFTVITRAILADIRQCKFIIGIAYSQILNVTKILNDTNCLTQQRFQSPHVFFLSLIRCVRIAIGHQILGQYFSNAFQVFGVTYLFPVFRKMAQLDPTNAPIFRITFRKAENVKLKSCIFQTRQKKVSQRLSFRNLTCSFHI